VLGFGVVFGFGFVLGLVLLSGLAFGFRVMVAGSIPGLTLRAKCRGVPEQHTT